MGSEMISRVRAPVEDLVRWITVIDGNRFNETQTQFAAKMSDSAKELSTLLDAYVTNPVEENTNELVELRSEIMRVLSTIYGYSSLLSSGSVGPIESDLIEQLRAIEDTTNYTRALVKDIFRYSVAILGAFSLTQVNFDINQLIHKFVAMEIFNLNADLDPNLPFALGDQSRTKGLISKTLMLLNMKAPKAKISLKAYSRQNDIEIVVTCPSLVLKPGEIFELGVQLMPEIAFAEWQKGNLRFENEPCATFYLTIPAAKDNAREI